MSKDNSFPHPQYRAALVFTGFLVPIPIVATIITVIVYIAPLPEELQSLLFPWITQSYLAVVAGIIFSFLLWLLLALCFRDFASIECSNPISCSHLHNHF